jgi:hypothetical protein
MPKFSADRGTKLSESLPYKMTTVQQFFPLEWEAIWKQEERDCHMKVVAGIHTFPAGFFFHVLLLLVCFSTTATSSYYILTCSVSHFVMDTTPFTSEKHLMSVRICEDDEVAKRLAK